jgi:hypothetical protein
VALLDIDGFDAGDHSLKWANPNGSPASVTTTRYGVGRSVNVGGSLTSLSKYFTASAKIVIGFAYGLAITSGGDIIRLYGDGGATAHLSLRWTSSTVFALFRGATQLATATLTNPIIPIWYYIEISATIDDTVGAVEVRVNGSTVMTFTGDTKNGGTANTIDAISISTAGTSAGNCYDDMYVLNGTGSAPYNDFLGEVRVYTTVPSGAGASTQWTPSAGTNFGAVDDIPYSAADYVSTSTSGNRDTYAMGDVLSGIGTVYAVRTTAIAKKSDAGVASLKVVDRSGGTNYYGPTTALNAGDTSVPGAIRTVDPATSAAWTVSGVNALEAGVELA